MKQLGNLALVCARRPGILMQVYGGQVSVFVGTGGSSLMEVRK